jgi:hypothetical protein
MSQSKFGDFLSFKIMISPMVILVLFWLGLIAIVVAAIVLFQKGLILYGIGTVIIGPFAWRISCEGAILAFRMYDRLVQIAENSSRLAAASPNDALKNKVNEFGVSIDDVTIGKSFEARDGRRFKVIEFTSDGLRVEYSEGKWEILAPIDSGLPQGLWTFDIRGI